MIAVVSWWNIADDAPRPRPTDGNWHAVDGLRAKIWIEEPNRHLWGAIMIWSDRAALERATVANQASALLGAPDERFVFEVAHAIGLDAAGEA